jgi:hypothetical protein
VLQHQITKHFRTAQRCTFITKICMFENYILLVSREFIHFDCKSRPQILPQKLWILRL